MILEMMLALAVGPANANPPVLRRRPDGQMVLNARMERRCRKVELSLKLPGGSVERPDEIFERARCPGPEEIEPLEHVVIEGLDRNGRRLWLARGWDSRFQRAVIGPAGEGHGPSGRNGDRHISTAATIPVTRGLARLRWYEVNPGYTLRAIGESRWTATRGE